MAPLRSIVPAAIACAMLATSLAAAPQAHAAKATSCGKVGLCYCMNDEHKAAIEGRIQRLRDIVAEQRKAGKAVVYLSVPLSPAGGGNFDVNKEVAESIKQAVEARFGSEYVYVMNSAFPDADLPRGAGGAEYMVMWTAVLEGADAKVGAPGQIAIVYDGQSVAPPQVEATVADSYVGKCPL